MTSELDACVTCNQHIQFCHCDQPPQADSETPVELCGGVPPKFAPEGEEEDKS